MQHPQDNVWQLILQLKAIVDLICAQQISTAQIAYLDVLIQEYLETRKALFPDIRLAADLFVPSLLVLEV